MFCKNYFEIETIAAKILFISTTKQGEARL